MDADEEPTYHLVRTKRFFFRPMSVDEAILQMNLVGHTFFAFRNEDEGGVLLRGLQAQRRRLRHHRGPGLITPWGFHSK